VLLRNLAPFERDQSGNAADTEARRLGRGTVGWNSIDRRAMGTDGMDGFGHGCAPSQWRSSIFHPNPRCFKRSKNTVRMNDHEVVIRLFGNLASVVAY
jgi:hypothetical protein